MDGSRHQPPGAPDTSSRRGRLLRYVGTALAAVGAALLLKSFWDLVRGGGPESASALILHLVPGPAFILAGLFLIERGRSMEPLPFSEYDDADGDRIPVHVGGLSSPDPWPQSASASSPPAWHPSPAMSPSSDVDPGNLQTYTPTSATSAILGTGHAPAGLPVAPRDWMVDPFSQPAVPPAHQEPSQTVATQPAPAATPPPVTTAPAHDPWAEASTAIHVSGPVASVAGRADPTVIETYRSWVTGQTLGHDAFQPLAVRDRFDEWFLLSASGVASLLAWTHEDHGATYSAETWVDQILPSQGISIADRQLAMDLLRAAALHAGGLHTAPTDRLMAYHPADLVTAMGTLHVGLLRLYSSLEGVHPGKVLRDQLGDSHDLNAIAAPNRPNWQPPRS